jgi:hypothetical protein
MATFFANLSSCLIGMEACSSAHYWARKLEAIPGIGPITASALVAAVGDAKNFTSGRQLAAWLGLVPRQHSTGGKSNLLGISKRGDSYLRTLLIHGARLSGPWWSTHRRGRPTNSGLLGHLVALMIKMRTNLPYRLIAQWSGVAHATVARMVERASRFLLLVKLPEMGSSALVDTTTIRLGRGAGPDDYTGYKHLKGIKIQKIMVDRRGKIMPVSGPYPASWHDKHIFVCTATSKATTLPEEIIGDKAYLGLSKYGVRVPEKRNHVRYKKDPASAKSANKKLNRQRVVVEHTFASIKRNKIFYTGFYFNREMLFRFFYSACLGLVKK